LLPGVVDFLGMSGWLLGLLAGALLVLPLEPDGLEPPDAVEPPEALPPPSWPQPANAPESANVTAATNAVTFMLTSMVGNAID
jgi:hypothetical protein